MSSIPESQEGLKVWVDDSRAEIDAKNRESIIRQSDLAGRMLNTMYDVELPNSRGEVERSPAPKPKPYVAAMTDVQFLPNPSGDAWRVIIMSGDKLLIVKHGTGFGFVHVLDEKSGTWLESESMLLELHGRAARLWGAQAAAAGIDGKMDMADVKQLLTWCKKTQSPHGVRQCRDSLWAEYRAMLAEGKTYSIGGFVNLADLDADKRFLGCANGVVDLDTGKLLSTADSAALHVTRHTGIEYDASASHPYVDELLAHLSAGDADYILDSVAWALRGNPARRWHLLVGERSGGKSTFLNAVKAAMGDAQNHGYGFTLQAGALLKDRHGNYQSSHQEALKYLPVARIAVSSEGGGDSKGRFNENLLKQITGGDGLTIREIYGKVDAGRPVTTTLFQAINPDELQRLSLRDEALEERTSILHWPRLPDTVKVDKGRVRDVTQPEVAQAMLAVLVKRAGKFKLGPPDMPESVADAVAAKRRADLGELGHWMREHIEYTGMERTDFLTREALFDAAKDALGADAEGKVEGHDLQGMIKLLRSVMPAMPPQRPRRRNGRQVRGYPGYRLVSELGRCVLPSCEKEAADTLTGLCLDCLDAYEERAARVTAEIEAFNRGAPVVGGVAGLMGFHSGELENAPCPHGEDCRLCAEIAALRRREAMDNGQQTFIKGGC